MKRKRNIFTTENAIININIYEVTKELSYITPIDHDFIIHYLLDGELDIKITIT